MFLVAHRAQTPAAVRAVAAAGATHFELDVRIVGSRLMVSHYHGLTWSRGWIERDNGRFRLRGLPPFDREVQDVLAAIPAEGTILFDPKDKDARVREVLAARLAAVVDDPARHVVSTKNREDLARFRAAGFRTWRTLDTQEEIRRVVQRDFPDAGATIRHTALTAETVQLLHGVTDTVVAWTVNNPARAARLAEFGVDGITTDRVALLTSALAT
jgi:glycerophosphoryl diester phosphodiesterase